MQTELKTLKAKNSKRHQENAVMAELQVGLHAYIPFCVAELLQTCMYPLYEASTVSAQQMTLPETTPFYSRSLYCRYTVTVRYTKCSS